MRNAAQRHLVTELGTLGATLVRFLYGLPFAALWLALVAVATGERFTMPAPAFFAWCLFGGLAQIAATALLLRTMRERNFAVGVAYSKTEVVQVALFSFVLLGDRLTVASALAVASGTLGVLLLAPADRERPFASLVAGLTSRSAMLGIGSGAGFALSAVAYRAATQIAGTPSWLLNAALTVVVAQSLADADAGRMVVVALARRRRAHAARVARLVVRGLHGRRRVGRRGSPRSPSSP